METNFRGRQEAAPRATEGKKSVATHHKSAEVKEQRQRGRPVGSKNRPKALIPKELAADFLGVVKNILPPEYYNEMKDAIRNGKNISTINEAKILLKLMGPPVWVRLIEEAKTPEVEGSDFDDDLADEIGEVEKPASRPFDKDLNERLKVMLSIMQFVSRLEEDEESADSSQKPILEIIARRGIDSGRVKLLVGIESGDVGGDVDGVGGEPTQPRTVSDQIFKRPLNLPDSQQGETVGNVHSYRARDDVQREHQEEL